MFLQPVGPDDDAVAATHTTASAPPRWVGSEVQALTAWRMLRQVEQRALLPTTLAPKVACKNACRPTSRALPLSRRQDVEDRCALVDWRRRLCINECTILIQNFNPKTLSRCAVRPRRAIQEPDPLSLGRHCYTASDLPPTSAWTTLNWLTRPRPRGSRGLPLPLPLLPLPQPVPAGLPRGGTLS